MSAVNIAEEMNVAVPERAEATTTHATRPFLWSIRRELWENPSIVVAPVAVACVIVVATLVADVRLPGDMLWLEPARNSPSSIVVLPLVAIAVFLGITMVGVAIFYSLDALHSERRDRSILFWKSLPISDGVTVFSKVAVPMTLLPLAAFAIAFAAQIIVFLIGNLALLAHRAPVHPQQTAHMWISLLGATAYSFVVVTLWYAPVYAWLLLVSAWARRAALVWAVVPFFVIAIFERLAFHSRHVVDLLRYRFDGVFLTACSHGLIVNGPNKNLQFGYTPLSFLASPSLWGGLLFAALALILIIRLRRSSDPI
jgi:ABC-2 type transport system permease protein